MKAVLFFVRDFIGDLNEALRVMRARQLRREFLKARFNLKARIDRVGNVSYTGNSIIIDEGWRFDCTNGAIVHSVGPDGIPRFCGYTVQELKEIHARRVEFNIDA